jgi:hypothetical protein
MGPDCMGAQTPCPTQPCAGPWPSETTCYRSGSVAFACSFGAPIAAFWPVAAGSAIAVRGWPVTSRKRAHSSSPNTSTTRPTRRNSGRTRSGLDTLEASPWFRFFMVEPSTSGI